VRKISTFRGDNFDNWLFTIASNVFRDYLKQKQRQKKLIESSIKQLEHYSEGKDPDFELTDKLQAELNNLDEETREILVMRFYSDMSFKEISEIRSEPIGTTLSKLHRGLKKLRNSFEINL
jgi:RNA polymerase sigma-70 factor (ECF subfamily)